MTTQPDAGLAYGEVGLCGSVDLGHWKGREDRGLDICVQTHPCGKMSALDFLLTFADTLALTLEAPASDHHRGGPGPHPRIDLHLNAGPDYGHEWCVIVDACAGCSEGLYPALFSTRQGTLGRHLTDQEQHFVDTYPEHQAAAVGGIVEGNRVMRPFQLINVESAVEAVGVTTSRIVSV